MKEAVQQYPDKDPFSRDIVEERTLLSMSKWMRFVGIFMAIIAIIPVVFVFSLSMFHPGHEDSILTMFFYGAIGILLIILFIWGALFAWQGLLLSSSGDYFGRFVTEDEKDIDLLTRGFRKLKFFIVIEIVLIVALNFPAIIGMFRLGFGNLGFE